MNKSEIETTLIDLKMETKKIDLSDPASAESIDLLIKKLEEQLSAPTITEDISIREHMQSTIEEFETSHPRLTLILNDLMSKLAGMGV